MPFPIGFNDSIDSATDCVNDAKWLRMFPQCVADKDRSSNFMTRAIYVAFSMILQRRNILAPEFFSTNYITEKLKLKSLCFSHPEAYDISCKLRSAGEAIKLGYLDELALVITNHEGDDEALEVFSFKMIYFEDGGVAGQLRMTNGEVLSPIERLEQLPYEGTQSVRDQLIMLARAVSVLCQKILAPLPEVFSANFRINYTSDAPEGYRVDGFYDSSEFYTPHREMQVATLGQLRPGYHGLLMSCSSVFIEDACLAEITLKGYGDRLADDLGYAANNTLYGSFISDNESRSSLVTEDGSNKSLASEFKNISLLQQEVKFSEILNESSPKKKPLAVRPTREGPYTRGRAKKV